MLLNRAMKYLNIILLIFIYSFGSVSNAQFSDSLNDTIFENKTFVSNEIIGFENFKYNPTVAYFELNKPDDVYGNITTFKNGKFSSGNIGPCGNECRVTVSGTYALEGNLISLFIETISFWKECINDPKQIINAELGTFVWENGDNGTIKLTSLK